MYILLVLAKPNIIHTNYPPTSPYKKLSQTSNYDINSATDYQRLSKIKVLINIINSF